MKYIFLLLLILTTSVLFNCSNDPSSVEGDYFKQPSIYYSPDEKDIFLNLIAANYSDITKLITIGYSVEGRPVQALAISDNPASNEIDEPRVRLSGSIHGNEYISAEILIRFIEYLTAAYDPFQPSKLETRLVNNRYIVIIPMINPDGVIHGRRNNSNYVDLNRNFDEHWTDIYDHGDYPFSEPESEAVSSYSLSKVFHLSATYHSGAVVVNLPFDYGEKSNGIFPIENDFVEYMGLLYAGAGSTPFNSDPDVMTVSGIINGGDWYVITGSMQDWSYVGTGCLDMTIEVAESSPLTNDGIEIVFNFNKDGMLAIIDAAGTGIYGRVSDSGNNPLEGVKVYASVGSTDYDLKTLTDSDGFYYKVLKPGAYTIKYELEGYATIEAAVDISSPEVSIRHDIQL